MEVRLDEPIMVGPIGDWWATWHGGPFIEIWRTGEDAEADVREYGRDPDAELPAPVHAIGTDGDDPGQTQDERVDYVRSELRRWTEEDGDTYRANGWG